MPIEIPHDPTAGVCAESFDRVESVDRQLAQTLKVRALAAEAFEQERGVRDGELVPPVRIGRTRGRSHRRSERAGLASRLIGTRAGGRGPLARSR